MLEDLQQFGLSEKEARVYLSSLEIGQATADGLSKHSGVNRSTTYVQIEELMKLGLMSTYEEGKKTFYLPESPEHLKRLFERQKKILEEQERQLEHVLPGLSDLFANAGERPRMRFFEGKEGLVSMREEVLKTKNKHFDVVFSYDHLREVFSQEERDAFSEQRVKKGITTRLLFTSKESDDWDFDNTTIRQIPEKDMPIEADIYVFDDSVAIASLKGVISGVLIDSPAIATSMRSIFEFAWVAAEKYTK